MFCCGPRVGQQVHQSNLPDKYNRHKMVAPRRLNEYKQFSGAASFHATTLPEVNKIFAEVAGSGNSHASPANLKKFLSDVQKMDVTDAQVLEFVKECTTEPAEQGLTAEGFARLLLNQRFGLFNPAHLTTYQDMDQPMNHYYINSSHNTYLIKDQLAGPASVEGYINAFRLGAKSVEIDCWDGPSNEPIVTHGHTLCGKILFKDVIQVLKEYAFTTSPYPLILSLEVHCSLEQQGVMAKHLKEILGDLLYYSPTDKQSTTLPSPNSLKNKILIKNKKLPEGLTEDEYETDTDQADKYAEMDEAIDNLETKDAASTDSAKAPMKSTSSSPNLPIDAANKNALKEKKKEKSHIKVAQTLSDLVILCQATTFKSFTHCIESFKYSQMSSFSESKSLSFIKNQREDFLAYNRRWLGRIYPKGSRVESSNYDPVPMWNIGASLIALNFQTLDVHLSINLGKYTQNGGAGYVLKPAHLIADAPQPISPKKVTIKILFAQGIPPKARDVIDPYLGVEVYGVEADIQKLKTKSLDNTPVPVWNETLSFTVTDPSLALIRFTLMDLEVTHGDVLMGSNVIPFTSLTQGYRHFALRDVKHFGIYEGSLVLTHVTIEDA